MASSRFAFDRLLVLVVSIAGIGGAFALMVLSWPAPDGAVIARLSDSVNIIACLLVLVITLLVAWRAGDHVPNMAIALALTFIYGSVVVALLFDRLHVVSPASQVIRGILFLLAAAFYIRSTQRFPRDLTAADIVASPTIWGRSPPLRTAAIVLLHPAAAWSIAATATAAIVVSKGGSAFAPMWMAVTATGLLFFYITLRGADGEARHKVLWFFEAALAAALISILAGAIDLAFGEAITPEARAVIQLVLGVVTSLIMVICFAAAVFYAGAISPALIVRKTLVYGATVALLLFLAGVVEIYVAHSLIHALHVNDRFATAVLGALFGLAFHPLKHRIEHSLRRFAPKDASVSAASAVATP
jgi:hypothetical protein